MRRTLTLAGFVILFAALSRPASAQSTAEQVAREGKAQVSRTKKYANAGKSKGYMSSPRSSMNYSTPDATGRFDMSGHNPPAYSRVREKSTNFSTRSYDPGNRRAVRSNYGKTTNTKPSGSKTVPPPPR